MGLVIRVGVWDRQYGAMKRPDAFLGQGTRITAPSSKADCVSVRHWALLWLLRTLSSLCVLPEAQPQSCPSSFPTGQCVDETLLSQPQTHKWLGRTRSSEVTRRTRTPTMNLPTSHTQLHVFIQGTALARVNAVIKLCVTRVAQPLIGYSGCRSAT
jgi:hypothetical protein